MDLAIGAKDVFVMMTLFAKDGTPKRVPRYTYPLTGLMCVSRVNTELGTFAVGAGGVRVINTYGIGVAELEERLQFSLVRIER